MVHFPLKGCIMTISLLAAAGAAVLWLVVIAIVSDRPQASLARGILASASVVAGAWASTAGTASANMTDLAEMSLLVSLLRVLG